MTNYSSSASASVHHTALLSSGSANTKGSWVQLIASTGARADRLTVFLNAADVTGIYYLFDIGTGAGGAETVLIPNLPAQTGDDGHGAKGQITFPVVIAASTRLSGRSQASGTSKNVYTAIVVDDGAWPPLASWTSATNYGSTTADSKTTLVTPTLSTADSFGSWTQLTASTTDTIKQLALFICGNTERNTVDSGWTVELATGAAAAEVSLGFDCIASVCTNSDGYQPWGTEWAVTIASSTRLTARAANSVAGVLSSRQLSISVIGTNATTGAGGGGAAVKRIGGGRA